MIPSDLEIAFRNLDWIIKGTKIATNTSASSIRFVDTSIVFSENFSNLPNKLNEEGKKSHFS